MWGQVAITHSVCHSAGIIPTRVGTRSLIKMTRQTLRDHPHACGDKTICSAYRHGGIGSSPRVWGQAILKLESVLCARIIPTRVGTRLAENKSTIGAWDHPHACGDKKAFSEGNFLTGGSSPRVWGQAAAVSHIARTVGIIPTRVGTRL